MTKGLNHGASRPQMCRVQVGKRLLNMHAAVHNTFNFASKGAIQYGAGFRVDTLVQIDAAHFVPMCGVSGVIVYSIRLFPPFPLEAEIATGAAPFLGDVDA